MIAAGASYITALEADLANVVERDTDGDRVSVISAGSRGNGCLLPVDGGFRTAVGGTDAALNTRMLALLAAEAQIHRFRHSAMAAWLARIGGRLPTTKRSIGKPATDDQVARRITAVRRPRPDV